MMHTTTAIAPYGKTGVEIVTKEDLPLTIRTDLLKFEALIADYPAEVRDDVVWLYNFRREQFADHNALLHQFFNDTLGIKISDQYLYQVLGGKYFRRDAKSKKHLGSTDTLKDLVAAARNWSIVNSDSGGLPFVEDDEWDQVRDYLDGLRNPHNVVKFGGIVAPTRRGKNRLVSRYTILNNHGTTAWMEASRGQTLAAFQATLGFAFGIGFNVKPIERLFRLRQNVRPDRMIIIQNFQKFYKKNEGSAQPILDYIQELQDMTGSVWVFTWTPGFTATMTDGTRDERAFFEQWLGRFGGIERVLELAPYRPIQGLKAILEKFEIFGGKESLAILKKWSRLPGRDSILFSRLQDAMVAKNEEGAKRLGLEHLRAVDLQPVPQSRQDEEEAA